MLFLEELMKKYGKEPAQDVPLVLPTALVDVDEAVRLIQANERGRQGRQRSAAMRDMRKEQAYEARMVEKGVTSEVRAGEKAGWRAAELMPQSSCRISLMP